MLAAVSVVIYATASFPSSVHVFATRTNGQTIAASWFNDIQDEVVAIETDILSGFANTVKPLSDAAEDLGTSTKQWRNLWLSGNVDADGNAAIGGTLAVTGAATLSSTETVTGTATHTGAVTFSSGDNSFKAGASTETHKGAGIINVDTVQAATGANTTDTTLFSYTLPANALDATGRTIRFTAYGTTGATANNKTIRIKWNGTGGTSAPAITTAGNGTAWMLQGVITRTGSSTQDTFGTAQVSGVVGAVSFATAAATDSGTITIHVTGQNGTAAASDIVYEGSIIEYLN